MSVRVTLMGTGGSAGVPLIGGRDGAGNWGACDPAEPRNRRSRSSILLQGAEQDGMRPTLMVDTSPDMRNQLLSNRVPRVDAVLYTHAHADHVTGLDDVRILNRIAQRPLEAWGMPETLDELQTRYAYAFMAWEPGQFFFRPVLLPRPISPDDVISTCGLEIATFEQDHGFIRTLGLRCGGFGYSTDAVILNDHAFEALEGVDTWVVGCFQRHKPHNTHAWLDRIFEWVERLQPRRTVLTHMGPDMDWAWLKANLPSGIEAGFDGMVMELD